jgi:hypothetical protein
MILPALTLPTQTIPARSFEHRTRDHECTELVRGALPLGFAVTVRIPWITPDRGYLLRSLALTRDIHVRTFLPTPTLRTCNHLLSSDAQTHTGLYMHERAT